MRHPCPRSGEELINVPVLRLAAVALALALVFSAALPKPASAAEPFGDGSTPALSPGMTPEQAAAARQLAGSDPEARKALEDALGGRAGDTEGEAAGREKTGMKTGAEAAAQAARIAAEPPYDWTKSAYVGGLFGKRLTRKERETVVHFGHDLFALPAAARPPIESAPVAPGYVVGPGDEIVVRMWGRVEGTQRMTVDRDGKIFFPKFGSLHVAGKTFEEVKSFLKAKVSTIAEVSSDVGMGRMKGIGVSVMGEVRYPGWYNVGSLHTAFQALSAAGRVKDIGSLRGIRIRRGGSTVEEVDLYDFLLKGDTRADIRLHQGDVVFVPVVGKLAAVVGEVRRPAIYELKGETSVLDLVRLAGGFTPAAYRRRIQVERLEGDAARVVLDAFADDLEKGGSDLVPADGDVVRVLPIRLADENAVRVEGNVHRPGRYEAKKGLTVGTLLASEKEFLPDTYFDYALIVRLVPPDLHKEVVPVNLREIVLERKPDADVALLPRDTLKVFKRSDFKDAPKASISGEVRLTREGALKREARLARDERRKRGGLDNQAEAVPLPEEAAAERPGGPDFRGEAGTGRSVYPVTEPIPPDAPAPESAAGLREGDSREKVIRGEDAARNGAARDAAARGTYARDGYSREASARDAYGRDGRARGEKAPDERSRDAAAGRDTARTRDAGLRDRGARGADDRDLDTRAAQMLEAEARGAEVRDVYAPKAESPFQREAVTFEIHGGTRVADLVKMAGGLTRTAYLERAEIVRVDDGRNYRTIYFHLGKAMAGDPEENKLLENEDQVRIHSVLEKTRRKTVSVSGEVNQPGDFVLTEGMKLSDLLFKSGGFREGAYKREAELVRREVNPQGDLVKTQTIVVYPERALSGDAEADVPLAADDYLYVRQIPDWGEKILVTLAGEFRFPGTYAARKGERLSSVIERAGGYTQGAYVKAAVFTRVTTREAQQEAIDRMIEELETSIAERGQEVSAALDKEDIESNKQLLEARRALVIQLKKLKAQGRVIVRLKDPAAMKGSSEDIYLEDGDRLFVPQKMNVVNVVGRVYNPTGVVYDPANDTVGHYLKTVGGPAGNADEENIFVLKANGSVVSRGNADGNFLTGGFLSSKVEPGDSIVVPQKLLEARAMKDMKDLIQIMYQIAVSVGVLVVAF